MSIQSFDTEEDMDEEFEDIMDRMQEESRLKNAIYEAEDRVGRLHEELGEAEEELLDLRNQLEALGF